MRRVLLTLSLVLVATTSLAGTPAFQHTFDDDNYPGGRIPQRFDATIGEAYVFTATPATLVDDPTCDVLSTKVLRADVPLGVGDFRVLFVHQDGHEHHPGSAIAEQEIMALKVGQVRTDVFGLKVGFESVGLAGGPGFQVFPIQLGPALPTDVDQASGRVYLNGAPTDVRYGNVMSSVCSGPGMVNNQVNVAFKLYGEDRLFFVEVTSFGPRPMRQTYGPFDLPDAFDNGYGACHIYAPAGTGTVIVDGVECIAQAPNSIDPINGTDRNHRDPIRRR
jgi:hypothetical protein